MPVNLINTKEKARRGAFNETTNGNDNVQDKISGNFEYYKLFHTLY